ncbi:hypothetical protein KTJ87_09600 [Rhodobacteraceae bacterium ASV31]|nr:hypothetical protein [Anianabacter salinae]
MFVVPKRFFVQSVVEKRPPLKATARRAGWIGSNILLGQIPQSGRIPIIENGIIRPRHQVLDDWKRTYFVGNRTGAARGWLVDVMRCVDQCGTGEFSISDVYAFEHHLTLLYPENANVRPKIRQQLQVLRDNGHIAFLGGGRYRRL